MWEAFEHAAHYELDNLTAILDVNRLGQRGETMVGWDLDVYVARAARSAGTRSRSTVTTSRRSTARSQRRSQRQECPHWSSRAPSRARESPPSRTRTGFTASRSTTSRQPSPSSAGAGDPDRDLEARAMGEPHRFPTAKLDASEVRGRRRGRDAQGLRRGARGARKRPRGRRRSRRGGLELDVRRDLQEGTPRPLLRDVHRRAADGRRRRGPSGRRLASVRIDVRRLPVARVRLRADGGCQPCTARALGVACGSLDRGGRPVPDGPRGHRRVPRDPRQRRAPPVRREPDGEARRGHGRRRRHRLHPHAPPGDAGPATGRTRSSRSEAAAPSGRPTRTRSRSSQPESPCPRRSGRPTGCQRTASRRG